MTPVVRNKYANFGDPRLNCSGEILPEAVDSLLRDNSRTEVVSDVISGASDVDVGTKLGYSRSKRTRDIRAARL